MERGARFGDGVCDGLAPRLRCVERPAAGVVGIAAGCGKAVVPVVAPPKKTQPPTARCFGSLARCFVFWLNASRFLTTSEDDFTEIFNRYLLVIRNLTKHGVEMAWRSSACLAGVRRGLLLGDGSRWPRAQFAPRRAACRGGSWGFPPADASLVPAWFNDGRRTRSGSSPFDAGARGTDPALFPAEPPTEQARHRRRRCIVNK